MTVYVAIAAPAPGLDEVGQLQGPWSEIRGLEGGALLLDSGDTLSRVYHELKWSLPNDCSLFVAQVGRSKLRGQPPGTQTWLRDRQG